MAEIELRSEKVRNIIGIIPPCLIRVGIIAIIILSCIISISCSIISVPVFVDCDITINKDNLSIEKIKLDKGVEINEKIEKDTPLIITLGNQKIYKTSFYKDVTKLSIQNDGVYISDPNLYIPQTLSLANISYSIDDNIVLRGKIRLKDTSLLSRLLKSI